MRYIETLKDGERISEVYLCKSKSIALTKTGKEYANVMLADKTGQIDSKIWDLNSGGIAEFDVNDYVAVTGQVTSYNGALQFKKREQELHQRMNMLQQIMYHLQDIILIICLQN